MRAIIVVLVLCHAQATRAQTPEPLDTARARQLARVLDIEPQIAVVLGARQPKSVDESIAHLDALETAVIELSRAALTVDATLARLQHEETEVKNAHDTLASHHENAVARWNIGAILIGSTTTIIGSGMQLGSEGVGKAGDVVSIAGAAVAAAFSLASLVRRDVGPLPLNIETNLLAPLLDRPATPRSRYPDWIWRYLETPLPGAKGSIRQELVEKWTREHRLGEPGQRGNERRLDVLTKPLTAATRVDAEALDDRADMLADVRERLAGLSVDLELLWREVRARR